MQKCKGLSKRDQEDCFWGSCFCHNKKGAPKHKKCQNASRKTDWKKQHEHIPPDAACHWRTSTSCGKSLATQALSSFFYVLQINPTGMGCLKTAQRFFSNSGVKGTESLFECQNWSGQSEKPPPALGPGCIFGGGGAPLSSEFSAKMVKVGPLKYTWLGLDWGQKTKLPKGANPHECML